MPASNPLDQEGKRGLGRDETQRRRNPVRMWASVMRQEKSKAVSTQFSKAERVLQTTSETFRKCTETFGLVLEYVTSVVIGIWRKPGVWTTHMT